MGSPRLPGWLFRQARKSSYALRLLGEPSRALLGRARLALLRGWRARLAQGLLMEAA